MQLALPTPKKTPLNIPSNISAKQTKSNGKMSNRLGGVAIYAARAGPISPAAPLIQRPDGHEEVYGDNVKMDLGVAKELVPREDILQIFYHIMATILDLGFDKTLETFANRPLKIATMCSGSESPIFVLMMANLCNILPKPSSKWTSDLTSFRFAEAWMEETAALCPPFQR